VGTGGNPSWDNGSRFTSLTASAASAKGFSGRPRKASAVKKTKAVTTTAETTNVNEIVKLNHNGSTVRFVRFKANSFKNNSRGDAERQK
jgi:hypothetical protein